MRLTNHLVTIILLFAGVAVAIALSIATGFWIDGHTALGSRGIVAFLVASAVILLCVEAVAGATGEWLERNVLRHR